MIDRSCKLGTQPAYVRVWGNKLPLVGKRIKYKKWSGSNPPSRSSPWQTGILSKVNPDGYLFIEKM